MTVDINQQVNEEITFDTAQTSATHVVAAQIEQSAVTLVAAQLAVAITLGAHMNASQTKSDEALPTPMALEKPQGSPNSDKRANYTQMLFRSYMQAQLAEIMAQLEELKNTGYANWMIIQMIIGKLNAFAAELKQDVIDPLRGLQDIDRAHSKLKTIIERIQAKFARDGGKVTKEDAEEFAEAVKELEDAVNKALEKLPKSEDGKPTPYEDLILRLKENLDKILDEDLDGSGKLRDIINNLEDPDNLKKLMDSLSIWARQANNTPATGPFVTWGEGKSGLTTLRLELQAMVTEYSDRLNRDSQLITSLNSMGQKHVELIFALLRTLTANQISR